jgi:hypothetical protein
MLHRNLAPMQLETPKDKAVLWTIYINQTSG